MEQMQHTINKKLINEELKIEEQLIENSISKYLGKISNCNNLLNIDIGSPWERLSSTSYKHKPDINLPNIKLIIDIHQKPIKRYSTVKKIISKNRHK